MARCGCAGTTCGCKVNAGSGIEVTGTGTAQDPYIISIDGLSIADTLEVDDTASINLTLNGAGTALDPYILSAVVSPGATVISTPTNGGTTAIDAGTRTQLLDHVATIAGHTITLPLTTTALEGEIKIIAVSAITALTVGGAVGTTVAGMPTTLAAGGYFRAQRIGTVWRRVG